MKHLKLIIILFIVINCTSNKAISKKESIEQFINNKVIKSEIKSLDSKGIDYFIYYKFYNYFGLSERDETANCSSRYSYHIIWEENNSSLIKKITDCGNYQPIKLKTNFLNEFYKQNFEKIISDSVKFYEVGNNQISMEIHTTFKEFLFKKKGKFYYNEFDHHNIENDSRETNLNYQYNKNLKIVKLDSLLTYQIQELDSLKLFKKAN